LLPYLKEKGKEKGSQELPNLKAVVSQKKSKPANVEGSGWIKRGERPSRKRAVFLGVNFWSIVNKALKLCL
jgi:hypothetical protein